MRAFVIAVILVAPTYAQDDVSFTTLDGWTIHGDLYGTGDRGVVLIDRIVLLAHGAYGPPEKLAGRKLFIVSRNDVGPGDKPPLVRIREQYEKAPAPKKLVILGGAAHAQFIFETDQAARLMHEILTFLSER
ncbi:MAG: hypothetical protein JOZ32_02380 [Bryobacterales bacterium]|nr:hypothetical protein [Bryobacterales bacterium]